MTRLKFLTTACLLAVASLCGTSAVQAETNEVRMSRQFGLNYLAIDVMLEQKLIEKYCKEAGLPDVKVTSVQLAGPAAMNDALLSGSLDFATGGVPALTTLWSKTKGTPLEVRAIGALGNMPNVFLHHESQHQIRQGFHGQGPDRRHLRQGFDPGHLHRDVRAEGFWRERIR